MPERRAWSRFAVALLSLLATASGFACRGRTSRPVAQLTATAPTDRVRVFLIERKEDGGHQTAGIGGIGSLRGVGGSRPVACGDLAVPVEVPLPQRTAALAGAIAALLALNDEDKDAYDPRSGLYNALYASPLTVERIERRGTEAAVYLKGYLEVDGDCDGQRALAQLTETALQFPDVQSAQFFLEGKPLREALAGAASP